MLGSVYMDLPMGIRTALSFLLLGVLKRSYMTSLTGIGFMGSGFTHMLTCSRHYEGLGGGWGDLSR